MAILRRENRLIGNNFCERNLRATRTSSNEVQRLQIFEIILECFRHDAHRFQSALPDSQNE